MQYNSALKLHSYKFCILQLINYASFARSAATAPVYKNYFLNTIWYIALTHCVFYNFMKIENSIIINFKT